MNRFRVTFRRSAHGVMVQVSRSGPHAMCFAYEGRDDSDARVEAQKIITETLARDAERENR